MTVLPCVCSHLFDHHQTSPGGRLVFTVLSFPLLLCYSQINSFLLYTHTLFNFFPLIYSFSERSFCHVILSFPSCAPFLSTYIHLCVFIHVHICIDILPVYVYTLVSSKKEGQRLEVKHKDSEPPHFREFKGAQKISFIIFIKIFICPYILHKFSQLFLNTAIQYK